VKRVASSICLVLMLPALSKAEPASESQLHALIRDPELSEISGMAVSRRHAGVLWMHNDSDGPAELFAVDETGHRVATVLVEGVENRDWEDIAAFERDGRSYLLIADTGDNGGLRRELELAVVAEPDLRDQSVPADWLIRFHWPDGPRDTESVAVSPDDGMAYFVSKKRVPPELWRVSIVPGDPGELRTAEWVASLSGVKQPTADDLTRNPVFGRYRSQITAFDISADGLTAVVLNYRTAYVYRRSAGEPWAGAVTRQPVEAGFPWLAQAEAMAISLNGQTVWITTERLPAPLISIPLPH